MDYLIGTKTRIKNSPNPAKDIDIEKNKEDHRQETREEIPSPIDIIPIYSIGSSAV